MFEQCARRWRAGSVAALVVASVMLGNGFGTVDAQEPARNQILETMKRATVFMVETVRPRAINSGSNRAVSVVLPLPLHPARPKIFIPTPSQVGMSAGRRGKSIAGDGGRSCDGRHCEPLSPGRTAPIPRRHCRISRGFSDL